MTAIRWLTGLAIIDRWTTRRLQAAVASGGCVVKGAGPHPLGGGNFLIVGPEEGYEEGATCNRFAGTPEGACQGTMVINIDTCSCWRSAPCSGCVNGLQCSECLTRSGPDGDSTYEEWESYRNDR